MENHQIDFQECNLKATKTTISMLFCRFVNFNFVKLKTRVGGSKRKCFYNGTIFENKRHQNSCNRYKEATRAMYEKTLIFNSFQVNSFSRDMVFRQVWQLDSAQTHSTISEVGLNKSTALRHTNRNRNKRTALFIKTVSWEKEECFLLLFPCQLMWLGNPG